jgi:hypothetical protein
MREPRAESYAGSYLFLLGRPRTFRSLSADVGAQSSMREARMPPELLAQNSTQIRATIDASVK